MITIRRGNERGHANYGWLETYHTFSFDTYYDPAHMGFRTLRVINEDRVAPGNGFPTHPHRNMEIITYVLEGALAHKDSMGTGSVIHPGEIQRMTAGTGVTHSEFNHSKTASVHFIQIWILPEADNILPSYEQKSFDPENLRGSLKLIAGSNPTHGAVKVHQDVQLFATILDGNFVKHSPQSHRHAWIQVTRGVVDINGLKLEAGDGVAVSNEGELILGGNGELLLFDLA